MAIKHTLPAGLHTFSVHCKVIRFFELMQGAPESYDQNKDI